MVGDASALCAHESWVTRPPKSHDMEALVFVFQHASHHTLCVYGPPQSAANMYNTQHLRQPQFIESWFKLYGNRQKANPLHSRCSLSPLMISVATLLCRQHRKALQLKKKKVLVTCANCKLQGTTKIDCVLWSSAGALLFAEC